MDMYADVFGWQPSLCKFPDWMSAAATTWRNLAGNHVYEIDDDDGGDTLRRRSATTHNDTDQEEPMLFGAKSFRCLHGQLYNRSRSLSTFVAVTAVHDQW